MRTLTAVFIFLLGMGAVAATATDTVVLDVRTKAEYEQNRVVGAQWMDFNSSDFADKVKKLDRNKTYKIYCASGGRAGKTERIMRKMGFEQVENLGGVKDAAKKLMAKCEGAAASC